jgi:membrane-bound serine protease (ClpP class)
MEVYEVKFKDTTLYLDSTQLADLEPSEKKAIISTKTIVEKGELLTMDDIEAANFGFSTMSVKGFDEMLSILGYENATIIRIDQNWSEIFVRFIGTIAPILLMLGFAALYIEMKAPGFGLPGVVGITCLALVFLSQYMVGLADYTELLILLIGLTLILIEVFVIPGFGVIGFAGIALLIIGMVLSFQDFVIPKPEFPWQAEQLTQNLLKVILSIIGSIVLTILFFRYAFPHLAGVIKGPYLMTTLGDAKAEPDSGYFPEIGEHGIVTSPLRPAGKITIKGETYDVVADGEFIDEGIEVQINEISGNRIVVSRRLAS